ncbi:cell division protein FtsZ [Alcanivorax sp. 1008]|uniref:cell division protein FtsZ n=1 Tax=Alcanivorax sp. 1008 TaxID=2816853 RepID=UPI001DC426C9|nr:cell division protein FtsZ [Alcanivorax sp. 1008]MCC1495277.1 cell division protein FtsZ [Alcanivorax sp. 1008]
MHFKLEDGVPHGAVIKVVGVGGGGGNAVEHMVRSNVDGVEFICANTDAQALRNASTRTVLQLGGQVTKGLGAGANPEVGRQSAIEDRERIAELLQGADMVFVTAGMGGGTGTGAAPIVAEVAKDLGILTVAVVTKPFPFEGRKRMQVAEAGIAALREHVDSLITIPNEKLMAVLGGGTTLLDAFKAANDVLLGAVKGISDLITKGGIINVDFADVRTVMGEMGMAMMGTGTASGENRAEEAARKAICSPLLEDVDLQGARGLLINISGNTDISLEEYSLVNGIIADMAHPDANIIIGTAIDPEIGDALSVTVVATGLGQAEALKVVRGGRASQPVTSPQNYGDLDQPAINRRNPREPAPMRNAPAASTAEDLSFIDIPTFLRRQAD